MLKTAVSLEIRIATQQSRKTLLLIFFLAIPLRSSRLCVKSQYVPVSQSNLTTLVQSSKFDDSRTHTTLFVFPPRAAGTEFVAARHAGSTGGPRSRHSCRFRRLGGF